MAAGVRDRIPHKLPAFTDDGPYVDQFGLLLLLTVGSIVGLSLFDIVGTGGDDTRIAKIGALMASLLVSATLLVALRASGLNKRRQRIIDVLVGIGMAAVTILTLVAVITDSPIAGQRYNPVGLVALLSVVVPVVVIRRVIRHRRVTSATLLGSIGAYLLIPVAFFHVFLAINSWSQIPFFGDEQPSTAYMYFSLVTVTTTGYGDLSAVTPLGRLAATSLAVVGQVYLVVFVAMIVGLRAQEWRGGGRRGLLLPQDVPATDEGADADADLDGSQR